ncbi:hypothetical protein NP590_04055 [Methylomonas sp. SURF-2]|uniref:Uncharacterized protein n=1 Tax=Methylomonas subterranea TaxID=2952225 RepID=A0ABT1TCT4_9GAMM|nr:hypothetical protein [Methylomonas sp. SURF-2]MCQ8103271.1 hypothetical protein [Methylomonas sp. SURF-2]
MRPITLSLIGPTALTAALLESGKFNDFVRDVRAEAKQTPAALAVFDAIYDHLAGKIDA